MRATFTSLAFVVMGLAANAQFSITPKAGIEPSITTIDYNNLRSFNPLGSYISPQISLRMDYKFKKKHGPYVGLSTSRSAVQLRFNDPEHALINYSAEPGERQVRIETGYQYSFKAINLSKANRKQEAKQSAPATQAKQGCHKAQSRSSCGNKSKADKMKPSMNKAWNLRIQPTAGLAFNPSSRSPLVKGENGSNYQYNAGYWRAALTTGVDFEFDRGRQRMFVVGFQYLKSIDHPGNATIVTDAGSKSTTTTLSSKASAWNVTVGVPFTLGKKQSHHKSREIHKIRAEKKQCIYYRPCRKA
ncbi:MAG: hypothetical protein WCF67_05185 [Chitinophagaceae bacterium]